MEVQVPFPFLGMSEGNALTQQRPMTTRFAENVRAVDSTGRMRGTQRPGSAKLNSSQINGSSKVQDIVSLVNDVPNIAYANDATPQGGISSIDFDAEPVAVETDAAGDVYVVLDRATIVRLNDQHVKQETISVPVSVDAHQIRPIVIDSQFNIYVSDVPRRTLEFTGGNSAAFTEQDGDHTEARLWKLRRNILNGDYEVEWEHKVGAFIYGMQLVGDTLYTCQNRPDIGRADIVAYRSLYDDAPEVSWLRRNVPYPVYDVKLNDEGAIFTTSPPNATRGTNPKDPGVTAVREDGLQLDFLENYQSRVWRVHVADSLSSTLSEGDDVLVWPDLSGKGRDLVVGTEGAPTYTELALADKAGIRFNGTDQWLTAQASSAGIEDAGQHKSLVPGYYEADGVNEAGAWVMFLVVRPEKALASDNVNPILGFTNEAATNKNVVLYANAEEPAADPASYSLTTRPGEISLEINDESSFGPSGAYEHPVSGSFVGLKDKTATASTTPPTYPTVPGTNDVGAAVITLMFNSDDSQGAGDDITQSLMRVNGQAIDRWPGPDFANVVASMLGRAPDPLAGHDTDNTYYKGSIEACIVFKAQDLAMNSNQAIMEHPQYPDATWNLGLSSGGDGVVVTDMEKVEGILAAYYGISHLLADNLTYDGFPHPYNGLCPISADVNGTLAANVDVVSMGYNGDILVRGSTGATIPTNDVNIMSTAKAQVCKFDGASGKLIWSTGTLNPVSGIGYAIAINSEGNIYTFGPQSDLGSGETKIGMITDLGDDYAYKTHNAGNGQWAIITALTPIDSGVKLKVDQFDNLYVPIILDPFVDSTSVTVLVVDKTGATFPAQYRYDQSTSTPTSTASQQQRPCYGVALPPYTPNFRSAFAGTKLKETIHVALGKGTPQDGVQTGDQAEVLAAKLLDATDATGDPRETVNIAISASAVKIFDSVSTVSDPAAITDDPSDTVGNLDAWSIAQTIYISSTAYVGGGGVYAMFTNGRVPYIYDALTGELKKYEATKGKMISRPRFLSTWAGRMVALRTYDSPQLWHMSAVGDPFDWNQFRVPSTITQSIDGVLADAGECPDIINTFIPYSNDWAIFGCDHSIWRLTGDPMAGGQFDDISKSIGMAFGKPWARDDEGNIYFYSVNGSVYQLSPAGGIRRMTLHNNLEKQLAAIDQDDFYVRMEYDVARQGLWIVQCPFAATAASTTKSWYWDKRTGSLVDGWWPDTRKITDQNPTALFTLDGDRPDDRKIVFGCQDGYIRYWDDSLTADDGENINSRVVIGPLAPASGKEYRFKSPIIVLGKEQGGCQLELYGQSDPSFMEQPDATTEIHAGRNELRRIQVRGPHIYMGLRSGDADGWVYEHGVVEAFPAGTARPRQAT